MQPGPILVDFACLCDEHTDNALELIHKAIGEGPPDDIWTPHPNPFVRRLVELFTDRGLQRIDGLEGELRRWLAGENHVAALERTVRPAGVMARWSAAELGITRLYLQSLPPARFVLDDWLLLVDYLVQRYLPEDDLRTEAEWLATRSALMGRVQASLGDVTDERADRIVAALPSVDEVGRMFGMTPAQRAVIDFGRARCCEHVAALTDGVRHRMRKLVVDHQEAVFLGDKAASAESIQSKLLDEFGTMNRDWRRIAVTEATENVNQGFVASCAPGRKLRRVEKYRGACPWCRSIDGKVVTVVPADAAPKNGDTEIWVGKTNVGRSASPRKREAGQLIEREPHERWWIAAGAQHPHCRGSWVNEVEGVSEDPQFEAWLAAQDRRGGA
jgi:hypothetical protein